MRKFIFTICLAAFILSPGVSFSQYLPPEVMESLDDTVNVVITEENFGRNVGLPEQYLDTKFYRVTECSVDPDTVPKDKSRPGVVKCNTLNYLAKDTCETKDWPGGVPTAFTGGTNGRSDTFTKRICEPVGVLVGKGGLDLIRNFVTQIYVWGASLVGIIAVLRIVIAGVEISTSQGAGRLEEGKNKIFQSIGGLVLLFLSAVLLYTINPNFFT